MEKLSEQENYQQENANLIAQGFLKSKKNLKFLIKFEGNVEKVKQKLIEKQQKKDQIPDEQNKYQSENATLIAQGFLESKKNLKFLIKFEGDVEKVKSKLIKKQQKKDQTINNQEKYQSENAILIAQGFLKSKKNLKFLNKFNGDVDKVKQILIEKQQKKDQPINEQQYQSENAILIAQGFLKSKKNLKLLIKFNGDVNKVKQQLIKKQQKKDSKKTAQNEEFKTDDQVQAQNIDKDKQEKQKQMKLNFEQFKPQLKIILDQGFLQPKRILNLLKKHDGCTETVIQQIRDEDVRSQKIESYSDHIITILATGLCKNAQQIIKFLLKHDGDIVKTVELLKKKNQQEQIIKEFTQNPEVVKDIILKEGILEPVKLQKLIMKGKVQ